LPKENDVSDETKTGEHDPNAAVREKVERPRRGGRFRPGEDP
jgi:hypothetical protein